MSDNDNKILRLMNELRRRRTFRVAAGYIVVGWVLIEVASVVLPAFGAAEWTLPAIIITVVSGLPVALALSWIFDLTPKGLQRTDDLDREGEQEDAAEDIPAELKPSIAVPLGTAERRQVSILRCTFRLTANGNVVSDPELMMAAIPDLNALIENTAERFSAYSLDASGPVFELLFGYPTAFENDAVRAVSAAFAIRREASKLVLGSDGGLPLQATCSASVHSDQVIIDDTENDQNAATVVGNSSLVAGWLQTLAPADVIGISEDTRALLRNTIRCESLGEFVNPQTGETTEVHKAVQLISPKDALSAPASGAKRMVGRESELALALSRWNNALDGDDQFVVLRGEAGIGKSTLVKSIADKVAESENAQLMPLYCSPFESSNPFHPIVEYFFGPGLDLADTESDAHKIKRVTRLLDNLGLDSDESGPMMAALLDLDSSRHEGHRPAENAQAMRTGQLQCLLDLFHAAAQHGPMCVIFEDIHWADPSTLEFISMLVNRESRAGALCVFTARPTLKLDWESRSNVTTLDLQRLPRRVTEELVRDLLDNPVVSNEVVDNIVNETGGNPLFVEELSKAIAESITDTEFALAEDLVLPGTVQQSLNARMDRLGDAKAVLQLCSLLGRKFDYRLLLAASATENEASLQRDLQSIVNTEFLYQEGAIPDSVYRFKHVLMQETARNSLLNATRIQLHAHVADIIEAEFSERAERNPALLAYHYGEGGQPEKSVRFWTAACERSLEAYAMREAVDQAESGLESLERLPHSQERDGAEIRLRSLLGKGLLALHGYADTRAEQNFTKAVDLSESMEEAPDFQIVVGLWMYFHIGGEAEHALSVARRLVRIADADTSPVTSLQAHYCAGYSLYRLGRFQDSREEFEQAKSFDSDDIDFSSASASGDDTRLHVHAILSNVYWHLGDEEIAQEHSESSRKMAEKDDNPIGAAFAAFHAAWLAMLRGNPDDAADLAATTVTIAEEKGLKFWLVVGSFMKTWASCEGGHSGTDEERATRLEKLEVTLESYLSSGAVFGSTSLGLQVAEDLVGAGQVDRGETWINRVKSIVTSTGEQNFSADIPRLEGRIAEARGDTEKAAKLFSAAVSAANDAGSLGLAGRAANDRTRLEGSS